MIARPSFLPRLFVYGRERLRFGYFAAGGRAACARQCKVAIGVLLFVGLFSSVSLAADIYGGYDLFATATGTQYLGVPFEGVPLGTFDFGGSIGEHPVGSADTIMACITPGVVAGAPGPIPYPALAMQLRTSAPHDLGAGLGTYYLTLQSARGGPTSDGHLIVNFDDASSGTFNITSHLLFDLRFGSLAGPIVSSHEFSVAMVGASFGNVPTGLSIDGVNHLRNGSNEEGDFWPTQSIILLGPGATHALAPAQVPEPSTFALAALGIVGLMAYARRRRTCFRP